MSRFTRPPAAGQTRSRARGGTGESPWPDRVRLVGAPVPAGESGATLTLDLTDARVRPQDVIKSEETWLRQLGADTIAWEPIDTRTLKAHVYLTHPLARVIDWRELAPVQGVKDHAPMGVTAIPGQQATFWWRGSQLVTGASGSGKTMTLRSMLRGLVVQQVPVRVTLADNKGDFVDWSTSLGVDQYARDHGDCVDLVDHFGDRMDQRYADRESWPIEDYALTPRPWEPLEVLIVGEGLTLLGRGTQAQQRTATRRVKEVAQTGREAACVLWLVTQTSTKDESAALAAVRDFFPGRILHRVPNASMITPALGVGADAGAAAHRIPMALEGVGYYLDPLTGWPVMFRGAYLPRSEQAHLSAQLGLTYSQDLVRQHEYDRALRLGADPDRTAWSANRGGTP